MSDLIASKEFYLGKLGWNATADSNDNIVFIRINNNMLLSLYAKDKLAEDAQVDPAGSGFAGFSLAHNVASEAEVNDLFAMFKQKGIHIQKAPEKVFWGGYSGYITDPDGYLWEIAYNPYMALDEEGNVMPT